MKRRQVSQKSDPRRNRTTATEAVTGSAGRPITVPAPNPNYTGRKEKLDQLADALRSGHAASIIGIEGWVALARL